jgi:hypothetical protein
MVVGEVGFALSTANDAPSASIRDAGRGDGVLSIVARWLRRQKSLPVEEYRVVSPVEIGAAGRDAIEGAVHLPNDIGISKG